MGLETFLWKNGPMIRVTCDNPACPNDVTCRGGALTVVPPGRDFGSVEPSSYDALFLCSTECVDPALRSIGAEQAGQDWPRFPFAFAMGGMIARYGFLPAGVAATDYLNEIMDGLEEIDEGARPAGSLLLTEIP